MVAAVQKWFGPMLTGLHPLEIEKAWVGFAGVEHNNTIKGALDIALHDLMGQILDLPCHRLLGAWGKQVRVTYICGYDVPQAMAEEALMVLGRDEAGIDLQAAPADGEVVVAALELDAAHLDHA